MEEIENRFKIIEIAVDLADYEAIETQIKRLRNVSIDKHLHEILHDLESKNFRQALYLMREYAATSRDDFFAPESLTQDQEHPTSQPHEEVLESLPSEGQSVSHSPSLPFEQVDEEDHILGLEEMLLMTKENTPKPRSYAPPPSPKETSPETSPLQTPPSESDPLFTLDQEATIPEETSASDDAQAEPAREEPPVSDAKQAAPLFEDDDELDEEFLFFDPVKSDEPQAPKDEVIDDASMPANLALSPDALWDDETPSSPLDESSLQSYGHEESSAAAPSEEVLEQPLAQKEESSYPEPRVEDALSDASRLYAWEVVPDDEEALYEKFAYMGQKFRNMMHQYPQIEEREEGIIEEVDAFIHMVSTHDYAESQVEAAVARYQELQGEGKRAEAAQMLIAAATTESTFAQFMLARELFKGEVLQQNYPESFTQINRLAEEDYAEAICDLGQLYEYGIGIDKNKRHAILLYEEAAQMGVERAKRHHERLKSSNPMQSIKSLTTSLLRKKK